MTDRISTFTMFTQNLAAIMRGETAITRTQAQISSGRKMLSAADDPVGAGLGVLLDRADAQLAAFGNNASIVSNRLNLETSALAAVNTHIDRIQTLAVEASNDTQSASSRASIVAELKQEYSHLVALANSSDGTGRYLFGGTADATAPFSATAAGVAYSGDQTQRSVAIGPNVSVGDSDTGSDVFLRIPSGNGSFAARAAGANTGTAVLTAASLDTSVAYAGGSYTVAFDGAGNYQVTDSGGNPVTSGAYTAGAAISFAGVHLTFDGQPNAGDSFSVQPAPSQDLFTTVRNLIATVGADPGTPAQRAAQRNGFFAAIEDLQQAATHVDNVNAGVGARLNTIDQTASSRADQSTSLKNTLSNLRDVDFAQAASQLNLQSTALQAAQLSFQKVQGLSLFQLLR